MHAFCAVSDSGTIAEESAILGFPAVTPRDAIERPEALDSGGIVMTRLTSESVVSGVESVTSAFAEHSSSEADDTVPGDYKIRNTSERVAKLILSTASISNAWEGIRGLDYDRQ